MKTEYHWVVDQDGAPVQARQVGQKSSWHNGKVGAVNARVNPDLLVILNNLAELSEIDAPRNADGQWLGAGAVVDWCNLVMQELKVRMKFSHIESTKALREGGGFLSFEDPYEVKYISTEIHVEAKDVLAGKVLSKLKKGELTRRKPKPEEMIVDID
jgi:hypothetical protein